MAERDVPPRARKARVRKRELERQKAAFRRNLMTAAGVVGAVAVVAILVLFVIKPVGTGPVTCAAHQVCDPNKFMHIHSRLMIYDGAAPVVVPNGIGVAGSGLYADHSLDHFLDPREGAEGQLAPVHTHDESGYIHVEADVTRAFTLGEFFDIWGQPLGPQRTLDYVADANHRLTLTVNGAPNNDWRELVLQDNQQIEIRYSTV